MLLAIDTSTASASVALAREGRLAAELSWDVGRRHSQELLGRLDELLALAHATPHDLTRVTVACGPGSFNGVRVAVTAAKSLAFALGLPLAAFSTLDVIASGQTSTGGTICAVLEAGRGEVYAACYRHGTQQPKPGAEELAEGLWRLAPPAIQTPAALAAGLLAVDGPVLLCGEWREETRSALASGLGTRAWFANPLDVRRAAWLAALALAAPASEWAREPATIEPLYLRRPAITMSKKQRVYQRGRDVPEPDGADHGAPEGEGDARALRG
jgi:tRNA threonylcarbamoyladenosine biosynthesis protein TsaB